MKKRFYKFNLERLLIIKLKQFRFIKNRKKKYKYIKWIYKKFFSKVKYRRFFYLKFLYLKYLLKLKYFLRKRFYIKNFFFLNNFIIKKEKILYKLKIINQILRFQVKLLTKLKFFLVIKLTKNNLFVYIFSNYKIKFFAYSTNGIAGFKGPVRSSPLVGEKAGYLLAIKARKFGINRVCLLLNKKVNKKIKECLKGVKKAKLRIKKILIIPKIAHNGVRFSKARRK